MQESKLQALTDHYNNSFNTTWHLWKQRNQAFLTLLIVSALGIVFTNSELLSAAVNIFALSSMGAQDSPDKRILIDPITYQVFHTFILISIFYLMVSLYHRSSSVTRQYIYLGRLEEEIRNLILVGSDDVAFSRESKFY